MSSKWKLFCGAVVTLIVMAGFDASAEACARCRRSCDTCAPVVSCRPVTCCAPRCETCRPVCCRRRCCDPCVTQVVVVPACDSCGVPAYGAPVYGYPTQEGSYESGTPITPAPTPTTTRRYNLLNGVRPGMLFPVVGYRAPQSYVSRTDSEAVYPTASRERVQTVRPVSASRTTLIMPRR